MHAALSQMNLEDRMSLLFSHKKLLHYTQFLLTCIEITVFGKVLSCSVELISRVVSTVTVKLDTGGEVYHQGGQDGDLIQ